jgi:hypothetical protein
MSPRSSLWFPWQHKAIGRRARVMQPVWAGMRPSIGLSIRGNRPLVHRVPQGVPHPPPRSEEHSGAMIVRHRGQRVMWLVRHAETNWNSLGWAQGQATGARLTPRGRRQALRLAELLEGKDITAIYSSDLPRALDTATTIADRLGHQVIVDPRLRERSLGEVEGSCGASLPPDITGISGGRITDVGARWRVAGRSPPTVRRLRCVGGEPERRGRHRGRGPWREHPDDSSGGSGFPDHRHVLGQCGQRQYLSGDLAPSGNRY